MNVHPDHRESWRRRVATVLGGLTLGIAALAFARFADAAQALFMRYGAPHPLAMLAVSPMIMMAVTWITVRWLAAARGSGIPQVIALIDTPERTAASGLLSLPVATGKAVLTAAVLLAGGAVGREGPTVQISASINVAVHRWLKVAITPGVLIAGGAAGVAAAFNTPLAGVAFAIEELASAYEQRMAALVMMTVMIAGFVSLGIAGDYTYLGALRGGLPLSVILMATPVAGVAGGLAGGLFSRAMQFALAPGRTLFHRLRSRPIVFAGLCGITIAAMGCLSGGTSWGTGYAATKLLVEGTTQPWWTIVTRSIATLAAAVSGTPGGIFAPSLAVGAEVGNLIARIFPQAAVGPIALLGMIAYFTGVVRAPLTSVIIVSEATASHSLVIPLFAAALIADAVSTLVCHEKLYHSLSRAFSQKQSPGGELAPTL